MRGVRLAWIAVAALFVWPAAANADVVPGPPAVSGPIVTGLIGAVACGVLVVVIAAVLIIRRIVRGAASGAGDTTQGAGYMPDQTLAQEPIAGSSSPIPGDPAWIGAGAVSGSDAGSDADSWRGEDADPGDDGDGDAGPGDSGASWDSGGSWDGGGDSGSSDSSGGAE